MDTLPEEKLVFIFTFIDVEDLCSCIYTCRQWERIGKDEQLWKELLQRDYSEHRREQLIGATALEQYRDALTELKGRLLQPHKHSGRIGSRGTINSAHHMIAFAYRGDFNNFEMALKLPLKIGNGLQHKGDTSDSEEIGDEFFENFNINSIGPYIDWVYYGNFSLYFKAGITYSEENDYYYPAPISEHDDDFQKAETRHATLLMWACIQGHLDIVQKICNTPNIDLSVTIDINGVNTTAIDIARKNGHKEVVKYLKAVLNTSQQ